MQVCTSCKRELPDFEFHWATTAKTRRRRDCRDCVKRKFNERKAANRDRYAVGQRYANIKYKYGLTREQFDAMLAEQGEACAICRDPIGLEAHVDHCHNSNAVRGLLCPHCNLGLGKFRDNPAFLRSALAYLGGDSD